MDVQKVFQSGSFRALLRLLVTQRGIRSHVIRFIEKKMSDALIGENSEGRPTPVQQDKLDYLMALMHGIDRCISSGVLSNRVMDRLLATLIDNVIWSKDSVSYTEQLGFRPPLFITISPTQKCNLRCKGCYACSDSRTAAKLDFETFDRILTEKRELWGSLFTVISGGEPFLWEDKGYDLLDIAARHSSNVFMVYTNGTLIDETLAKRMEEVGNITPAISVEGFQEQTDDRRGKGVHEKILRAFDNLRRAGVPFGISATATKHNWDIVTSDEFADFYYEEQGALYGWIFQYMPIGRKHSLDLMVTPEQRLEMLKRTFHLVRDRKIFIADFWNSGTASNGCIAGGRAGGYLYIDWDGDVTPCVFIPYAAANIYDVYRNGGNLNTVLETPLFKEIRDWQAEYGYTKPADQIDNWLCPCAIRDHYEHFYEVVRACGGRPIDSEAEAALQEPEYVKGMIEYGKRYYELSRKVWEEEYLKAKEQEKSAARELQVSAAS